ncbi:MAG: hypothetical protein KME20_06200 [Kaiparowitsia implicata GSE-PSE-MK54-09C]|jgi:hypothetical protein|nr:hypothetical protein [Kaiparowitsia implicata GSE-PSE-MK54-09C]
MANEAVIRLTLDSSGAEKDARALAADLKKSLGNIKINGNLIDLGDSQDEIARLTVEVTRAQAALADGKGAAELQRQASILQENLRFKQQLAQIEGAGLSEKDATAARALATELNNLNLAKIEVEFQNAAEASTTFSRSAEALKGVLQGLAQAVTTQLIGVLSSAGSGITGAIGDAVNAAAEYERVIGSVDRLVANSNVGLSTQELIAFADELGNATLTSEEAVLRASRSLLTFQNVTGDTFKRTLAASQDLAEALGGSLEGNILSLGKALENPVTGLNALARSGTVFTKQQREQVKALVESGRLLEAQGVILDEVERQYGGAAVAAAQGLTGALDTLGENANDITRGFGEQLLPALTEFVNLLQTLQPQIEEFAIGAGAAAGDLIQLLVNALKFAADNGEILATVLQALVIRFLALKAVGLAGQIQATAIQMGLLTKGAAGASISIKGLTGALATGAAGAKAAAIAFAPLLIQLAAVAVAIEAIKFAKFANDLAKANTQIAAFQAGTEASTQAALAAAGRTKTAAEQANEAKAKGIALSAEEQAASERLVAANDQRLAQLAEELKELEALKPANEEQENSKAALIKQNEIATKALQSQNNTLKEAIGLNAKDTDEIDEKVSKLSQLNEAYRANEGAAETYFKRQQTEIAEGIAAGTLTEETARQQALAAESAYYQQRLELATERLAALRALESEVTDPKEKAKLQEDLIKAEQTTYDLRTKIAEQASAERVRAEEDALETVARANEAAARTIAQSQTDRTAAIRQQQLAGVLSVQQAEQQILAIQQDSTRAILAQKQQELREVQRLRAEGVLSAEQAAEQESGLQGEIAQLNLQAIEGELAAREAAKQAAIKAIQDIAAEQRRASDLAVAEVQRQVAALDQVSAQLQQQNTLLQSRATLQSALSNLERTQAQTRLDGLRRAEEIQRQLSSGEIRNGRVRRQLERELQALGVERGTNQLALVQRRQAEEQRLAQIERDALAAKQQQESASLDLELRRNAIATQRLQLETRIAELQALQNQNAAQAALREAETTGDANQIADARTNLQLAQQGTDLAQQARVAAEEQAAAQAELAQNAREALDAQQEAERAQADAANESERFAAALERAAASTNRIANNLATGQSVRARRDGGPVSAGSPYLVGEEGPELVMPRRSGFVLTATQTAQLLRQSVAAYRRPSLPGSSGDSGLLREIQGLRKDLRGIERPVQNNTVTVQSQGDPVSEALRVHERLLLNQIRSMGL